MFYKNELNFFQSILKKCYMQSMLLDTASIPEAAPDFGLRTFISDSDFNKNAASFVKSIKSNTLYNITDNFSCCYFVLMLPDTEKETLLIIGPYLPQQLTQEKILEFAETLKMTPKQAKQLEKYYSSIPVFEKSNNIFSIIEAFAESIYGKNNFHVIEINRKNQHSDAHIFIKNNTEKLENTIINMQIMESRYAYENELMMAVSNGQAHKAELMLAGFSQLSFEKRLSDPVRNMKNYCIIMNTLLRKAAENGGVHPVYLDTTSSEFAKKIEKLSSIYSVQGLMIEMFRAYCNLVNKHSIKNYSSPVKKAIVTIDSDLTADLSLSALAKMQNLSAGYLSTVFKKETGQTLTEYVNEKRIKLAKYLLKTSNLQIQTIAQHCGILDIQYFSKMFKKHTGKTPKEYREEK